MRWMLTALYIMVASAAWSTPYRNVVNLPFNTRSNGHQNAIVVDIPASTRSATELRQLVSREVAPKQNAQVRAVAQQIRRWKQLGVLPPNAQVGVDTLVVLRQNGQIIRPQRTRYGNGTLSFTYEGWTGDQEAFLRKVINAAVPLIEGVYGKPAHSSTVKVVNYDEQIGDRDALAGGIFNASTNEILFPVYKSQLSVVINLIHLVVHAFHGPLIFEYDAWEEGFARAVTLLVTHRVAQAINFPDPVDFFKTDPLYHSLPFYDLLNQPALGNNLFFAPSQRTLPLNTDELGGMYYPRLAMAGSAWLKVYMEDNEFFRKFNAQYYAQYNPNETIKLSGDIPRLKQIAASVITGGTVEGLSFDRWYESQYVLDTSVAFGRKLYAWVFPDREDAGQGNPGFAAVLLHYQTDTNGDETPLNDVCYPIYWDADQQNRLFLGVQYERVDFINGQGTVAPLFINIGGPQRVFVDFPVSGISLRIVLAPGHGGSKTNPKNLYGAVLGLNSGTVEIGNTLGVNVTTSISQGGFGVAMPEPSFGQLARYTLVIRDTNGNIVATRKVNLGYQEAVLVVEATDRGQTLTRSFPQGLQMISLPIQPFTSDNAVALGVPQNHLLLAHWRQDTPGDNKYLLYPKAPPFRPGLGYWIKLRNGIIADFRGLVSPNDQNFTIGTTFGWNQIGNPFTTPVNASEIEVQYLLNDPVPFATAVSKGWVGGTIWRYNPSTRQYESATTLQPWEGYWLRVLVSEGVTLTFPAPANRSRLAHNTRAETAPSPDWQVSISAKSGDTIARVKVGQSYSAGEHFDPIWDREAPPPFEQMLALVVHNPSWGTYAGRYAVDIRRTGTKTTWNLQVHAPSPYSEFTLTWNDLRNLPARTRLVLLDEASGRSYDLRSVSSVTLLTDASGTRSLQLIAEPQAGTPLRITQLRAHRSRGGAYTMSFFLSAEAQVQAEVISATGKPVKLLQSGTPSRVGIHSLLWDGRDSGGVAVPAGAYLLRVRAQTEDGTSVQAILPLVVTR